VRSTREPDISVINPVFNEGENILLLHGALSSVLKGIDQEAEVIFIDDGSSDDTLIHLQAISEKDPSVKVLALSRNVGQPDRFHSAMAASSLSTAGRSDFGWLKPICWRSLPT